MAAEEPVDDGAEPDAAVGKKGEDGKQNKDLDTVTDYVEAREMARARAPLLPSAAVLGTRARRVPRARPSARARGESPRAGARPHARPAEAPSAHDSSAALALPWCSAARAPPPVPRRPTPQDASKAQQAMADMLGNGDASEDSLADAARERELAAVKVDPVGAPGAPLPRPRARPLPLSRLRGGPAPPVPRRRLGEHTARRMLPPGWGAHAYLAHAILSPCALACFRSPPILSVGRPVGI